MAFLGRFGGYSAVLATAVANAPPPPVEALSALISGPTAVKPWRDCTSRASVTGGHTPYLHHWYHNGIPVGSDEWLTLNTQDVDFWLRLDVGDAWNDRAGHEIYADNTPAAFDCFS